MSQIKYKKVNQLGGGSTDFWHSANSVYIQPGALTRYTLKHIDQAPMFNPLRFGGKFPTPTSGIGPVQGIYYMNKAAQAQCKALPQCTEPGLIRRTAKSKRESLIDELKRSMM